MTARQKEIERRLAEIDKHTSQNKINCIDSGFPIERSSLLSELSGIVARSIKVARSPNEIRRSYLVKRINRIDERLNNYARSSIHPDRLLAVSKTICSLIDEIRSLKKELSRLEYQNA